MNKTYLSNFTYYIFSSIILNSLVLFSHYFVFFHCYFLFVWCRAFFFLICCSADGSRATTRVKKVTGDRDLFIQELRSVCNLPAPKNGDPRLDPIRLRVGGTIEVKGKRVREITNWLASLGFWVEHTHNTIWKCISLLEECYSILEPN